MKKALQGWLRGAVVGLEIAAYVVVSFGSIGIVANAAWDAFGSFWGVGAGVLTIIFWICATVSMVDVLTQPDKGPR